MDVPGQPEDMFQVRQLLGSIEVGPDNQAGSVVQDGEQVGLPGFFPFPVRQVRAVHDEEWVKKWFDVCGYNPCHAPAHLHINYLSEENSGDERFDKIDELRFPTGAPNPLAIFISLAEWLIRLN